MKRMILLLLLPALGGCATPRQSCLQDATRDVAVINALIAETNANLERGYAIEQEIYTSSRVEFCASRRNYVGGPGIAWNYCTVPDTRTRDKPVAIDPAAERRKLAELQQARRRAESEARQKLASCDARYPQ